MPKLHTYDVEVVKSSPEQDPCAILAEVLGEDAEYRVVGEPELTDADYRPKHWSEFWTVRIETQHELSEAECEDLGATPVRA